MLKQAMRFYNTTSIASSSPEFGYNIIAVNRCKIPITIGMLLLCLDYRSQVSGGGSFQYILTFMYFIVNVFALMYIPKGMRHLPRQSHTLTILAIFLAAYPIVTHLFQDIDNLVFLKLESRFLMLLLQIIVLHRFIRAGGSALFTFKLAILSGLLSALSSAFATLVLNNTDLADARYRLFPTGIMISLAASIPFIGRFSPRIIRFGLVPIGFLMMVFSTTRGATGAVLMAGIVDFAHSFKNKSIKRVFWYSAVAVVALTLVIVGQNTNIVTSWTSRLTAGSQFSADPTTLTRVAEYKAQMKQVASSAESTAFGVGLGASYDLDYNTILELIRGGVIGNDEGVGWYEFGHSLWVYSFFSMGIFGGWILPAIVIGGLVNAIRASWPSVGRVPDRVFQTSITCAMTALSIDVFIEHPFGLRSSVPVLASFFVLSFMSRDISRYGDVSSHYQL